MLRTRIRPPTVLASMLLLFAAASIAPSARAQSLPSFRIDPRHIYVAGISSGGAMAVQMDVAYSKIFKGAAIYAGLPYDCGQAGISTESMCAENAPPIDIASLEQTTQTLAKQKSIDPLSNLKNQPIYLWSGLIDVVVRQPVMDNVNTYYQYFGANVFKYDNGFVAQHAWESPYGPNACQVLESPFVNQCTQNGVLYDSQEVFLSKWLGKLKPKNEGTLTGSLSEFDQNPFVPGGSASAISLDNTGFIFTPAACAAGKTCSLILAIHGCSQYYGAVGLGFVGNAGLNEWADTNNIVVVYPQTIASTPNNGLGCWDWWGYTNSSFALKDGPQMQTLFNIVKQVAGKSVPAGG
ncbi:MAG TPA: PHB depolymerase family esterase [Candidatus Binataceae bacterium]|nr:PHB depolymerase family esterase [Candidatus Binataceae bacterium]